MNYARNYARCCLERQTLLQRWFIRKMTRKANAIGQASHRIWSLKFVLEEYLPQARNMRILDCGAWNGWFLSYESPRIHRKVALDFDSHYAPDLLKQGIQFVHADMEKGALPFAAASFDLVAMTSTLEHLGSPEPIADELHRILAPRGIVFITVPDIMKYRFHFWDDVTHKRPFNAASLKFLFETHGFETLTLCPYNHNLFIAGNLFPRRIQKMLTKFRGKALMYVGTKARS